MLGQMDKLKEVLAKYRHHPDFLGEELSRADQRGAMDDTPLHISARKGEVDDIGVLVSCGADINSKGDLGFTPLHYAAMAGQTAAVNRLLELGADPLVENEFSQTPWRVAALGKHWEIATILRAHGQKKDLAVEVAKLSGYLSGLAAEDGEIREYTAAAYVVSGSSGAESPEDLIREFYAAQTDMKFTGSQKLEGGLGDLERQLGSYVIRRPWGVPDQTIAQNLVDDRRRFLAFRIMDMIDAIAPEAYRLRCVYKLESMHPGPVSRVTFLCVRIDVGFLVLQFNDDTERIRG